MITLINLFLVFIKKLFSIHIGIGISINQAKNNSILFFPNQPNTVSCGISAFIAFKGSAPCHALDFIPLENMVLSLKTNQLLSDSKPVLDSFPGSDDLLCRLFEACQELKQEYFFAISSLIKTKKTPFYPFHKPLSN